MTETSERRIELIDIIEIVLQYKWWILFAAAVSAVGGWMMADPPGRTLYQADSLLMVRKPKVNPMIDRTRIRTLLPPTLSMELYQSLALADDLRMDLIDSLGLWDSPSQLDGMMRAQIIGEGSLELQARSPDREIPVRLVNAWAQLFVERNRGLTAEALGNRYEWVIGQYETARANLEAGEDSLHAFEAQNPVEFLQLQDEHFNASYQTVGQELHQLRVDLQRNAATLAKYEEVIEAVEAANPFVFQAHIDTGFIGRAELTAAVRPYWEQLHRVRQAQLAFGQDYQLARLQFEKQARERELEFAQAQRLDSLQFGERRQQARRRFDREHRVDELRQDFEELTEQVQHYRSLIVRNPEGEFSYRQKGIGVLEEEWRRHKPTPQGSNQPNPIYLSLGQRLADQRVELQLSRTLSEAGQQQIEGLEAQREKARQAYHAALLAQTRFDHEATLEAERFAHESMLARVHFERDSAARSGAFEQEYELTKVDLDQSLGVMQEAYDEVYQIDWHKYVVAKKAVGELRFEIQGAQKNIKILSAAQRDMQIRLRELQDEIAFWQLQRRRLGRTHQVYKETFASFSKLLEETRIDREKAAGDIQLLTRAIESRRLTPATPERKTTMAGVVGLLLSTLMVFLIEYVRKARARRAAIPAD